MIFVAAVASSPRLTLERWGGLLGRTFAEDSEAVVGASVVGIQPLGTLTLHRDRVVARFPPSCLIEFES